MRKQVISAKLKLKTSPEVFNSLRLLVNAYKDALNFTSNFTFKYLNKTSKQDIIHATCYETCRTQFCISAQLTCSVIKNICSIYKGLQTKLEKHEENVKKGYTKKVYKGLSKPPKFYKNTIELQYKKDFTFKKNNQVSIPTLGNRVAVSYEGYVKHVDHIQNGGKFGGAKLLLDSKTKTWYLIVSITIENKDINKKKIQTIKGIDVGQRNLFYSVDSNNNISSEKGNKVKQQCRKYSRIRKSLQKKDTPSSKKVLKRLGQRERRFNSDTNHKLSLKLLTNNCILGMEDLKGLRENTMRKRRKGNSASDKQRQANHEHSSWSYAQLKNFVFYKTIFYNSKLFLVDPHNTSKMCNQCKHIDDLNRPNGAIKFKCVSCGYEVNSDLNASYNIMNLTTDKWRSHLSRRRLSSVSKVTKAKSKPKA